MNPFQFDMALQRPVFYMMRRGILIDPEIKREFGEKAHENWDNYQSLLDEVVGTHMNVNSTPRVHGLLYHYPDGLQLPVRKKLKKVTADEDALRAIMADAAHRLETLQRESSRERWLKVLLVSRLILKVRGVRKELSNYTGCPPKCGCTKPSIVRSDDDNRMRCTIAVGGTETFRFSHSKSPQGTGNNQATIPHKIRRMYVADDGYELAELDLNRGESWVYAHLSEDPELLRIHLGGLDFHAETASVIQAAFGGRDLSPEEIGRLSKGGDRFAYRLRYLAKRTNHSSAYKIGIFEATNVINEESDETGITVVPSQVKKAQALWKAKYFGVPQWWDQVAFKLRDKRQLVTSYGRVRDFYGFMDDQLVKEGVAWEPQSTSVDYTNHGMLRVFDDLVEPGILSIELLHQNHDSILVQYPIQHRDLVIPTLIEKMTSVVVINGHEVSIPIEATHGNNWGDYHPENNPDGLKEWEG